MEGKFIILQVCLAVLISSFGGIHSQSCADEQCSFDDLNLTSDINSSLEAACYNRSKQVNFTCQGVLQLGGPPYNECQDNGTWRFSSSPFCEDVRSCELHDIENGISSPGPNANSADGYQPYEIIKYSCNDGYIIQGPESATCGLGGNWIPVTEPECSIRCGEAPRGTNGVYRTSPANFTVNATVYFECYSGFSTNDVVILTCQGDGEWSADGPNCTDINECDIGSTNCNLDNQVCVNTRGSYECECALGFSKDASGVCIDDVSLECGLESFRVVMNLAYFEKGVEASSLTLMGDQSCRATQFNDTIVIESKLNACGTSLSVTQDYVEYLNIIIDADDAELEAPNKIFIPVMCYYSKSDSLNPRSFVSDFQIVRSVSRIRDARFDFLVYEDNKFLLPALNEGSLLDFTSPTFLEIKAEYSGDVKAGVEQCWATDEDGNERVQLITDGCLVDDSLVTFVETDNPAIRRFIVSSKLSSEKGISKGQIHCDVLACDLNSSDSISSLNCDTPKRRKRSLNGFVHAIRLSVR